jgi:hypothetical protein
MKSIQRTNTKRESSNARPYPIFFIIGFYGKY